MPIFLVYLIGFIKKFTLFGRYLDLSVGVVMMGLGIWWQSPWTMFFGALSIAAFAFDLNGWVQRRSMAYAQSKMIRRK